MLNLHGLALGARGNPLLSNVRGAASTAISRESAEGALSGSRTDSSTHIDPHHEHPVSIRRTRPARPHPGHDRAVQRRYASRQGQSRRRRLLRRQRQDPVARRGAQGRGLACGSCRRPWVSPDRRDRRLQQGRTGTRPGQGFCPDRRGARHHDAGAWRHRRTEDRRGSAQATGSRCKGRDQQPFLGKPSRPVRARWLSGGQLPVLRRGQPRF